jgi:hypothetical protein
MTLTRLSVRQHAVIFATFALIACLPLYTLLFNGSTHVPGDWTTDYYHFHWNYWWMRHAWHNGLALYETNYVFAPLTNNLAYHTLTPLFFPVWALLEPWVGTLWAMNTIFVLALALCGYSMFCLLRSEQIGIAWALGGGVLFMLTGALLHAVMMTTLHYLGFFWLPLLILLWKALCARLTERPTLTLSAGAAVLLGAALYGTIMTDYQYALYALAVVGPFGVARWWVLPSWGLRVRLALIVIAGVAAALAALWWAGPLPALLAFDRSGITPPPMSDAHSIPFPLGYLSRLDPYQRLLSLGAMVLPLLLISVGISLWQLRRGQRDGRRWLWLMMAVPLLILSAGPYIMIGDVRWPMPYSLLHEVLGGVFRNPARFGVVALLPMWVFIGRTYSSLRLSHGRAVRLLMAAAGLCVVLWDARVYAPMPLIPVPYPYTFYAAMGREPYDYVVLEVPTGGGTGEALVGEYRFLETQFYGLTHGKRMVNGMIARAPISAFWYLRTDSPALSWLGQRRLLDPVLAEADLRRIIAEYPVGYIVIHQDIIGLESPTNGEIIGYLNSLPDLLCPAWIEGAAVVYRTSAHPDFAACPLRTPPLVDGTYQLDIGGIDEAMLGWGWHRRESVAGFSVRWTGAPRVDGIAAADLWVMVPPAAYRLTLTAQAYQQPLLVQLWLNDVAIGSPIQVDTVLGDVVFEVPASAFADSAEPYRIRLTATPAAAPDGRPLALMVERVRLTPTNVGDD